jgi:hypothetical protein
LIKKPPPELRRSGAAPHRVPIAGGRQAIASKIASVVDGNITKDYGTAQNNSIHPIINHNGRVEYVLAKS